MLWGASISAHQVEGGNHNQWSVWELRNAKSLAKQAEYKETGLPRWERVKPHVIDPGNYISGRSTGHHERYEADFDLAVSLNMNALRFSIEWSRIQPDGPDSWNLEAIEYYRRYLAALKQRGLQPVVTLWHFTNPVWFEEKGGFQRYANISYFVKFVERVMKLIGADIKYIVPINEPDTYILMAFLRGEWPPQKIKRLNALQTFLNMHEAHRQVYKCLKKNQPTLPNRLHQDISIFISWR